MPTRPTYLVAVSNGSIYIGYSPSQMTLCTSGSGVLDDTPNMAMQDGPASPNDSSAKNTHRTMYFCDGKHYVRLDSHTGKVSTWIEYIGTDEASGDAISGFLPYTAGENFDLTATDSSADTLTISGDHASSFTAGDVIAVKGSTSGGLDGSKIVVSAAYDSGTDVTTITCNSGSVAATTADGGGASLDTIGGVCRIMCLYRNRIVLAGLIDEPQNWFMSAVADPRNWDYSPPTISATQAVAGNNSDAGELGDRITALIPFSDDVLIFGGDHSIWQMTGDPAAGGSVDNVSQETGIVGPDAWAFDPSNILYFMGNNGLYAMAPGGAPKLLSGGRLDRAFRDIDLTTTRVLLQWDRRREGLNIFLATDDSTADAPTSWFYDARAGGAGAFWPMELPAGNGPSSVATFDTDAAEDRKALIGGLDGYIRGFDDLRANDNDGVTAGVGDDVAIDSYVDIGPFDPGGLALDARLDETRLVMGEGSGAATLALRADDSPEDVAVSTTNIFTQTLSGGRNKPFKNRARGNAFMARISQNAKDVVWSYESGTATFAPAGKTLRT